jgi:hypothetical protein
LLRVLQFEQVHIPAGCRTPEPTPNRTTSAAGPIHIQAAMPGTKTAKFGIISRFTIADSTDRLSECDINKGDSDSGDQSPNNGRTAAPFSEGADSGCG